MRGGGPTPNGKCHEKVFFGYPSYLHVQFTSRLEQDFVSSEPPAKSDREPIYDLSNGNKADPKTKPAEAAKAGDEVQPSHLWRPFEFWNKKVVDGNGIATDQTQLILQRRCSQWRCPLYRRCSTHQPDHKI